MSPRPNKCSSTSNVLSKDSFKSRWNLCLQLSQKAMENSPFRYGTITMVSYNRIPNLDVVIEF